jgi:hypothetical protein
MISLRVQSKRKTFLMTTPKQYDINLYNARHLYNWTLSPKQVRLVGTQILIEIPKIDTFDNQTITFATKKQITFEVIEIFERKDKDHVINGSCWIGKADMEDRLPFNFVYCIEPDDLPMPMNILKIFQNRLG